MLSKCLQMLLSYFHDRPIEDCTTVIRLVEVPCCLTTAFASCRSSSRSVSASGLPEQRLTPRFPLCLLDTNLQLFLISSLASFVAATQHLCALRASHSTTPTTSAARATRTLHRRPSSRKSHTSSTRASCSEHRRILQHVRHDEEAHVRATNVDSIQVRHSTVSLRYVDVLELAVHVVLRCDRVSVLVRVV